MLELDKKDLDAIASGRANRNKKLNIIFVTLGIITIVFLLSSLVASEIGVCYNVPTLVGFVVAAFILVVWYVVSISVVKKRILNKLKEEYSASIHKS